MLSCRDHAVNPFVISAISCSKNRSLRPLVNDRCGRLNGRPQRQIFHRRSQRSQRGVLLIMIPCRNRTVNPLVISAISCSKNRSLRPLVNDRCGRFERKTTETNFSQKVTEVSKGGTLTIMIPCCDRTVNPFVISAISCSKIRLCVLL
jgi:hypothetical protein